MTLVRLAAVHFKSLCFSFHECVKEMINYSNELLSLLFMLPLLSASQTGDLIFTLETVVYKKHHHGNTHTHAQDSIIGFTDIGWDGCVVCGVLFVCVLCDVQCVLWHWGVQ